MGRGFEGTGPVEEGWKDRIGEEKWGVKTGRREEQPEGEERREEKKRNSRKYITEAQSFNHRFQRLSHSARRVGVDD